MTNYIITMKVWDLQDVYMLSIIVTCSGETEQVEVTSFSLGRNQQCTIILYNKTMQGIPT